jgi:heme iron utilization protein
MIVKDAGKAPNVLLETDEAALKQARRLVRGARHAALAVIEAETGYPSVSRALVATDWRGRPVVLVSALSTHTKGLVADPRCSLLFGEPGKGDPLAHPRITLHADASRIERASPAHRLMRQRFLARHPKAELYIDFPDFCFYGLTPRQASLNGGFGRAYSIDGADLLITSPAAEALAESEAGALAHMNSDHADAVGLYATALAREAPGAWRLVGLDAEGLEVAKGDRLCRIDFDMPLQHESELRAVLVEMAKRARAMS